METREERLASGGLAARRRLGLAAVLALVVLLRVPFLNQAIQGDDVYYLAEAQHAQVEPAHPNNFRYVYLGNSLDFRGHSHPPLNGWILGGLLAVVGDIREVPFHAAYIVFSLIAAAAMWSLAERFSPHPFWATLLFLATPVFVVNGTSFETDVPFLAFWMAAIAFVAAERYWAAALAAALAAMMSFQAVFLTPILAVYAWLYARKRRGAWLAALAAPATLAAWQAFERLSSGSLPAAILTGYIQSYGLQAMALKVRNAAALSVHFCWIVFPLLLPPALIVNWKKRDRDTLFLTAWIVIFFGCALAVFWAGSARYLLPVAAPVALLVSRLRPRWLAAGFAAQMALSLSLAWVNYQHWDAYRRFAASLAPEAAAKRVWINGDWGLRYYMEAEGALPLETNQSVRPGDLVVSSELAYPVEFTTGGGMLTPLAETAILPTLPLRLIGLDARSGYSTAQKGLRPFDISSGPVDRVRAELVVERQPTLEYLPMKAPEAARQIVSGIYPLENGNWRWMAQRGAVLLKSPAGAARVHVVFFIPGIAPARRVRVLRDGELVASATYSGPGTYTLDSPPVLPNKPASTVAIEVDKTFSVPGDSRQLGIILSEVGFKP